MRLELREVSKVFQARGQTLTAIDHISFQVADGEFVCLIGPSGCGKSTLLNMLAGLELPTEGSLFADEVAIAGPSISRVLIFQDAALFPWLNVEANVEFGLEMKGVPRGERKRRVQRLLQMVHLEQFGQAWVHELSGGMRQRVALARALAVEPAALLLDEPFGALDAITRDLLHTELQDVWLKTGKTVVFVTHNVREAVVLGDRVIVMSPRPGRLVAEHAIDLPRPRQIEQSAVAELSRHIAADLKLREDGSRVRH